MVSSPPFTCGAAQWVRELMHWLCDGHVMVT